MRKLLPLFALSLAASPAYAAPRPGFHPGPVFTTFGPIATVASDMPIAKDTVLRTGFNVSEKAKPGELSRAIESAARFINMHVDAGVPLANIHVAIVVHGPASTDLLKPEAYAARNDGAANGSADAIAALTARGVEIWQCGQSAAAMSIAKGDLLPNVKMALSAMTAFALLQQRGYTVNPF
jgi:intracellular sulfur oxidation DsrE/DsrF family protein